MGIFTYVGVSLCGRSGPGLSAAMGPGDPMERRSLRCSWEVYGTPQKPLNRASPPLTGHFPPSPHLPLHLGDPPQFSHSHWGQCWDPSTQILPSTWSRHSPLWISQGLFSDPSNLILHPPRHLLECSVSCPASPGPAYPCCLCLTLFSDLLQATAGVTPNRLGNSHQDPSVGGAQPESPSVSPAKWTPSPPE